MHVARESTLGDGVKGISTYVTAEPKITLGCHTVTRLFFYFSFSIVVASRPATQPLETSRTVSCHGNFSGQCSPCCCSCSALWDLRFRTPNVHCRAKRARPSAKPMNQPTSAVYSLCERSLGTFACCPAQKTSKSPLYCSVPNVCMYVCGSSVCVYLISII